MNTENIEKLKQLINDSILPLIDNDYVLLDVPHHHNIGDTLIWQGERVLLRNVKYNCVEESSIDTFDGRKISDSTIILFQGGGNWGDTWEAPHKFRKNIIFKYPKNKIIVFPQSINYINKHNLQKDIDFFKGRKNITLCVRDNQSYHMAKEFFPDIITILIPDMAFLLYPIKNRHKNNSQKILFLKRGDKEYKENNIDIPINSDVHDWPTFEWFPKSYIYLHRITKIMKLLRCNDCRINKFRNIYWNRILRPQNIKIGIDFISNYNIIYSTRLHVALLACMLGKQVYILDNIYRKNISLYETWLKDFDNIKAIY